MAMNRSPHGWLVLALIVSVLVPGTPTASAQTHATPALGARGCPPARVAASRLDLATHQPVTATIVTDVYSITASANDASRYVFGLTASTKVTNTTMKLGTSAFESDTGGYRFISVTWPSGAQLLAAHFRLTASSAADAGLSQLQVYGEAVDSAAAYSTSEDFTQRSLTSASVTWVPGKWLANQTKSITVTQVISEVINRPGWASGNPVALQTWYQSGGFAQVWAWDGSITRTAQLELIYRVPGRISLQAPAGCPHDG